ncbi:MAG: hypothetical protein ACOC31_04765 [Bacteroidota bacterium]
MEIIKIILISIVLLVIIFAGLAVKLFFNKKPSVTGTCGASAASDGNNEFSCGCGAASSCQTTTK